MKQAYAFLVHMRMHTQDQFQSIYCACTEWMDVLYVCTFSQRAHVAKKSSPRVHSQKYITFFMIKGENIDMLFKNQRNFV